MSEEVGTAMRELRSFMFHNVYKNPNAKQEEDKAKNLLITLYEHYKKHLGLINKMLLKI